MWQVRRQVARRVHRRGGGYRISWRIRARCWLMWTIQSAVATSNRTPCSASETSGEASGVVSASP